MCQCAKTYLNLFSEWHKELAEVLLILGCLQAGDAAKYDSSIRQNTKACKKILHVGTQEI